LERFPCLRLAYAALRAGGAATGAFNAANEVAVAAFLERKLKYLEIPRVIEATLAALPGREPGNLDEVLAADGEARRRAGVEVKQV